jgi:CRP/FNR family transcriptional regulator, cyclic AMP receptor protein
MIERFQGVDGRSMILDAVRAAKVTVGVGDIVEALVNAGELIEYKVGEAMVVEGGEDNDFFLLLAGKVSILVLGNKVAERGAGDHIGEIAMANAAQTRTATVVAMETTVALRISAAAFRLTAEGHPRVLENLLREANNKLAERNRLVRPTAESPRLFIASTREALLVAQEIQANLAKDFPLTRAWTDGTFTASNYTLEDLEAAFDETDFAITIWSADDLVVSRDVEQAATRDNVILEFGFALGKLGRQRSFLLVPQTDQKIPSDLLGIKPIGYRTGDPKDLPTLVAPACLEIRKAVRRLGPR